jgi:hypothetical protein
MTEKIVHRLKAHDFILDDEAWKPIASCPRDGSEFWARCTDNLTHKAAWRERPTILDANVGPKIRAVYWKRIK